MSRINLEMTIGNLLAQYPETVPVFTANGFPATTKEALLELVSPQVRLTTMLKVKGINENLFIQLLDDKIQEEQLLGPLPNQGSIASKPDFLGYTYCPIKYIFKECFDEAEQQYLANTNDTNFTYFVPSGCDAEDDPYEDIWQVDNIEYFPDVIVAGGFGNLLRQEFVDKFIKKGYFKQVAYQQIHPAFDGCGYEDPEEWYTAYSAMPIVMLVDRKKLGSLPVPKKWSDLLDPMYQNNIILGASHDDIHEDVLLYLYKEHGDEGLVQLAANVKGGLHGAQMAVLAGTAKSGGAAIYVIPWLFAKTCPRLHDTVVVWPEDGALITPMYLLAKEKANKNLQPFIDFVMGEHYGQKTADSCFPVLNPHVDNKLPENACFKWLGWDYIRNHSMEDLKSHVIRIFKNNWKGSLG